MLHFLWSAWWPLKPLGQYTNKNHDCYLFWDTISVTISDTISDNYLFWDTISVTIGDDYNGCTFADYEHRGHAFYWKAFLLLLYFDQRDIILVMFNLRALVLIFKIY